MVLGDRGLGYQMVLMVFCLAAFWGCGVSLGALFTFKLQWGLPGLWLGIMSGVTVAAVLCMYLFIWTDWDEQAELAMKANSEAAKTLADEEADGS